MKKYIDLPLSISIFSSILTSTIVSFTTNAPISLISVKSNNVLNKNNLLLFYTPPTSSSSETHANGKGECERRIREIDAINNDRIDNNGGMQD